MRDSYRYTILFMLIVAVVFTGVLATTNVLLKPAMASQAAAARERALLNAFDLLDEGSNEEVAARFAERVERRVVDEVELYQRLSERGEVDAYAVPFGGAGLWGSIEGYLAVSADFREVIGLTFTAQNETPGLGGRIDEPPYRNQFRGLAIAPGQAIRYGDNDGTRLDAVTGATLSSNAVLRILNEVLTDLLPELEVQLG